MYNRVEDNVCRFEGEYCICIYNCFFSGYSCRGRLIVGYVVEDKVKYFEYRLVDGRKIRVVKRDNRRENLVVDNVVDKC